MSGTFLLDTLFFLRHFVFLRLVSGESVLVVLRGHLFSSGKFRYANSLNSCFAFLSYAFAALIWSLNDPR